MGNAQGRYFVPLGARAKANGVGVRRSNPSWRSASERPWRYLAGPASGACEAIRGIDADQPVTEITIVADHVAAVSATERFSAVLMASLAGLGLALSALWLYGVMSYSVNQSTRELGLRLALGARTTEVFKLVMKRGATLSLIGLAIGTAGAFASTRFLGGALYGVSATDPMTFVAIGLVLAAVALAACLIPARRATKVDPLVAIKSE